MQNSHLQDQYLDAATTVLDWDIAEDGYGEAVSTQAMYLAGPQEDWDSWGYGIDRPVH